jgi:hypothetical protein
MQGRPRPTSPIFESVRWPFGRFPNDADIHLIRRCWDDLRRESTVKQRSICLDSPRCAVTQKCAHGRADPANMPKNLVILIWPQIDGDSYSEANFIVRIRHSTSWHIASGPAANPVPRAGKFRSCKKVLKRLDAGNIPAARISPRSRASSRLQREDMATVHRINSGPHRER